MNEKQIELNVLLDELEELVLEREEAFFESKAYFKWQRRIDSVRDRIKERLCT